MPNAARDLLLKHFRWIDGHADVWAVFRDAGALSAVVAGLVEPFRDAGVTAVCGIESRGFLLGAAAAIELDAGFVAVRKADGLFPGEMVVGETELDYRKKHHTFRLQRDALTASDRVLLVDDWIETGSQATTVKSMVEQCGATWVGCSVMIEQLAEERRAGLGTVVSLATAQELQEPDSATP